MSQVILDHPKVDYLSVSDAAVKAISEALADEDNLNSGVAPVGVKIFIPERGCGGLTYEVELAYYGQNLNQKDELLKVTDDCLVFVDPAAVLTIFGSEMDYYDNGIEYGFKFVNPNEAGSCGCGSSFFIHQADE